VLALVLVAATATGALLGHAIAWSPEAGVAPARSFDAAPGLWWAHGVAASAALVSMVVFARRGGCSAARLVAGLVAACAVLGLALGWGGAESLVLAAGHNLAAALAWAGVAWLAAARMPGAIDVAQAAPDARSAH